MRTKETNHANIANILVYAVAGAFAIPFLAAFMVPGTLATAICFTLPYVGVAYLCGKTFNSTEAVKKVLRASVPAEAN